MNYLDAVQIISAYAHAFALGSDENSLLYRPLSNVPPEILNSKTFELNKDLVITGHKIFIAHGILFNTFTQEEMNMMLTILKSIDLFVHDEKYQDIIECASISNDHSILGKLRNRKLAELAKRQTIEYLKSATQLFSNPYRYNEIVNMIDRMIDIKEDLKQKGSDLSNLIARYFSALYDLIDLDYDDSDYICFQHPKQLKKWLSDERFPDILNPYRRTIEDIRT